MKRWIVGAIAIVLTVTACSSDDASKADLQQPQVDGNLATTKIVAKAPDSVVVYVNVDKHPNIAKLCIEGIAFRTISETYVTLNSPAAERVPEWDASCKK